MIALPEAERKVVGRAGRAHIEGNCSLDRVVDQWEALYEEFLQQKGFGRENRSNYGAMLSKLYRVPVASNTSNHYQC